MNSEQMIFKNTRHTKIVISFFVLAVMSFFLFFRLGYYALWDDEAICALFAQSVWHTGDTSAIIDHNLIAFNYGKELDNLSMRYIPPLQFYLVAPFVGLVETSTFAARLPFAICGLLTVAMMLLWLWKGRASVNTWLLTSLGILGNVSLMLHSRQCRYYAPTILLTTVLAFLYFFRDNRRRTLLAIVIVSLLLLASNYMCYVAAYICMAIDYYFWGRKTRTIKCRDLAIVFIPQLILGGLLMSIYNPLGKDPMGSYTYTIGSWLTRTATFFLWNLREINTCEFGVGILIIIAPLLYRYTKDDRLLRCPAIIFTYCFFIAIVSPQGNEMRVAIVRYLVPLIPICIFTAVLSIQALTFRFKWLAFVLALLAFGTNILHGGPAAGAYKTIFSSRIHDVGFRSTIADFTQELISPNPNAYRATADWINRNLGDKESILVLPGYATYPLMYHAPKATYAWQLEEESGQFIGLPGIHFKNRVPPEYIVAFGTDFSDVRTTLRTLETKGIRYIQVKHINIYWSDLTRPELYWHSFREIQEFSPEKEAIYIFKRVH